MAAPTITTSVLTGGSNSHETTSEEVNGVATDFISEGIVGTFTNTSGVAPMTGAFAVNASGSPDANINISTGVAYVTGTPTSQNSQTLRIKCSVTGTLAISSNSSGSTKYDWIYISLSATNAANPNTAGDDVATIVASRSTSASSDDGTPPTYGYPIAVVTVANGFTTITNGNIRDLRSNSTVNLGSSSVSSGWIDLGYNPATITANGNRSYSCVFSNVDLTSTLSNGMRLKLNRLVTAPTQCADLEASSSQYFSKTSPTGVSWTDDDTRMGWVKLESYAAGGIIARRNADTEGWSLGVNAIGQVVAWSGRIAANNSSTVSYQSLPLNKWVHVAATTNLSGTSVLIYIDGVLVPSATTITGTITALVQGTTALVVGAEKSAGTNPLDGKVAQTAIFNAVLTEATIRSYMSQTLSGAEPNSVSVFTLNNSLNDSNANANNLTAQNSAAATNADTPFAQGATGTTEYAIITSAAFSTDTTLTVQVPEGSAIPTTGGVSAVAYSTQKVPYGMPVNVGKWEILYMGRTDQQQGGPAQNTFYFGAQNAITIPVGAWNLNYCASLQVNDAGGVDLFGGTTLSTSTSAATDIEFDAYVTNTGVTNKTIVTRQKEVVVTTTTPYYLLARVEVANIDNLYLLGSTSPSIIRATFAYV